VFIKWDDSEMLSFLRDVKEIISEPNMMS
jgi:hypothetical protein